jgi:hypothetical protein
MLYRHVVALSVIAGRTWLWQPLKRLTSGRPLAGPLSLVRRRIVVCGARESERNRATEADNEEPSACRWCAVIGCAQHLMPHLKSTSLECLNEISKHCASFNRGEPWHILHNEELNW